MSEADTGPKEVMELNGQAGDAAAATKKKKKKKKKKKSATQQPATTPALELLGESELMPQFKNLDLSATLKEARPDHPFWANQPVLNMKDGAKLQENEAIEIKTLADVQKEPLALPAGFEWVEINANSEKEMLIVYELLEKHYVTDDDGMFRFDYGIDLIRWAICPPGWKKMWHIGVRRVQNQQIVGFITAVPCLTRVYGKEVRMVEINFLCVHRGYRDKRIAPVLIKEITRRVNLNDIWQATFTAGVVLPHPVASCRYYHRSLNPKKLIGVGFSAKNPKLTMASTIKLYSVPDETITPGLRPLEKRDIGAACKLLNSYLSRFHLSVVFDEEEFEHWFLPRAGVLYAYVVQNPTSGLLTDMISFYRLPSSVLNHPVHKTLDAGYSFYNVAAGTDWVVLMKDALTLAKREKLDVFNCLDVMDNNRFISELKFGKGDGNLQMYLFNWKCPPTEPSGVGIVLM